MVLLVLPVSRSLKWLNVTCVLCIVGIWIEKGMGLVIPGFIPTPLGEMMEYVLRSTRRWSAFGIWAFGLLCYTDFSAHVRADSPGTIVHPGALSTGPRQLWHVRFAG
jgi:Zn-dependent protease